MIKVPGTTEGLPAIRELIADGISINITLLFSRRVYVKVAEAYLSGLEQYVAGGGDPGQCRERGKLFRQPYRQRGGKQLDEGSQAPTARARQARLTGLTGKVAIAGAKLAYQEYKRLFSGARWDRLAARAQAAAIAVGYHRPKNTDYSDVVYVEELIGPNTVNTMPPATVDAFRDHGKVRDGLEENVGDAEDVLAEPLNAANLH